jgi:hypothetical protein
VVFGNVALDGGGQAFAGFDSDVELIVEGMGGVGGPSGDGEGNKEGDRTDGDRVVAEPFADGF